SGENRINLIIGLPNRVRARGVRRGSGPERVLAEAATDPRRKSPRGALGRRWMRLLQLEGSRLDEPAGGRAAKYELHSPHLLSRTGPAASGSPDLLPRCRINS